MQSFLRGKLSSFHKKIAFPHKPRDLTQFKGKGEISCKKEGQNLTFSIRKVRLCNRFQRKFYLMRKKRKEKEEKTPTDSIIIIEQPVMLLRRIFTFILYWKGLFYWKQKGGKKIQASFMIEANSYKKLLGAFNVLGAF